MRRYAYTVLLTTDVLQHLDMITGTNSWLDILAMGEVSGVDEFDSHRVLSVVTDAADTLKSGALSVVGVPRGMVPFLLPRMARACERAVGSAWYVGLQVDFRCHPREFAALLADAVLHNVSISNACVTPSRARDVAARRGEGGLLRLLPGGAAFLDTVTDSFDARWQLPDVVRLRTESRVWAAFCGSPDNCLDVLCYAPWNRTAGGCEPSPYFLGSAPSVRTKLDKWDTRRTSSRRSRTHRSTLQQRRYAFIRATNEVVCVGRANEMHLLRTPWNGSAIDRSVPFSGTADGAVRPSVNHTLGTNYNYTSDNDFVGNDSRAFHDFKRHTAWMFSKWYDWSGRCAAPVNESARSMRGGHSAADGLYHLENFCVNPLGEFSGYLPRLDEYRGADDVHLAERNGLRDFATLVRSVKQLSVPPPCFLDTKIVVFGVGERADNPGHIYYRLGSLMRIIEAAYGVSARDQRDNVTMLLPIFQPDCLENRQTERVATPCAKVTNAAGLLMDLGGTSHIALSNPSLPWSVPDAEFLGFTPDARARRRRVCFRHAVLWQDGWKQMLDDLRGSSSEPGRQTSFPIHGRRTVRDAETVDMLNVHLRRCLRLPPRRRRARPHAPHVMFAVRSVRRVFSMQPFIIDIVGRYVQDTLHGTLEVSENAGASLSDIVRAYSRADVLIGHYGAALVWQTFMPPGAVTVEFNGLGRFCPTAGVDPCQDREYNGGALMSLGTLLVMPDIARLTVRTVWHVSAGLRGVMDADHVAAPDHFIFVLQKAACVLRRTERIDFLRDQLVVYALNASPGVQQLVAPPVGALCGFGDQDVSRISFATAEDRSGELLRRQLLLLLYDSKLYSPKLDIVAHDPNLAARLTRAWSQYRARPVQIFRRVHIVVVEPCQLRFGTLMEFLFFRDAFSLVAPLRVAEYGAGRE